jgi:hypothetical protein
VRERRNEETKKWQKNDKNWTKEYSSDVQLEWLEFAANTVAPWTPWCPTSSVLADKDIDAFLTQSTNAFRACIAIFQN